MVAPKVTILIPTYNQADLVKRAVDSALSQSYAPLEVIVCDDSRDNKTKELLVPIEGIDNRFIYIQNRSRLGRVENYKNALYQCATGEWALMLDGDDFLIDNKFISDAMEVIMQDPTIVMV
ncbi:MAG: glycosyltransferase family 2 protein, partial [Prevotellaceae bacterium]|nr:glycosyltransferase family 2 protein [Prevotellaceae bacterium]